MEKKTINNKFMTDACSYLLFMMARRSCDQHHSLKLQCSVAVDFLCKYSHVKKEENIYITSIPWLIFKRFYTNPWLQLPWYSQP